MRHYVRLICCIKWSSHKFKLKNKFNARSVAMVIRYAEEEYEIRYVLLLSFFSFFECLTYFACFKIYLREVNTIWISSFEGLLPWRFTIMVFNADGVLCRTLFRKVCSNTKEDRIPRKNCTAKAIMNMKCCLYWKKEVPRVHACNICRVLSTVALCDELTRCTYQWQACQRFVCGSYSFCALLLPEAEMQEVLNNYHTWRFRIILFTACVLTQSTQHNRGQAQDLENGTPCGNCVLI